MNIASARDGGGYLLLDGTSMACPHAAGVLALLYQARPSLGVDQALALLRGTARDLGVAGLDNVFGSGLIDAQAAVGRARAQEFRGRVTDQAGRPLQARVAYSGPSGEGGCLADEGGRFTLPLAPGSYTLAFTRFGFVPAERRVEVGPDGGVVEQRLQPMPVGSLAGRVVSASGQPVPAVITVLDTPVAPVSCDAHSGCFSVPLPVGEYGIRIFCRGFAVLRTRLTVRPDAASETVLTPAELAPYLVYDDDGGDKLEQYYTAGFPEGSFDVHDVSREGPITDVERLLPYRAVLWPTGARFSAMTADDQALLASFLAAGGRLFLTGQNIASTLESSGLLGRLFRCRVVQNSVDRRFGVRGLAGDSVSGRLPVLGLGGPANQMFADAFAVTGDGSVGFLEYDKPGAAWAAGVRVETCGTRAVFTGFGLEGVTEPSGRAALLRAVLDWLEATAF